MRLFFGVVLPNTTKNLLNSYITPLKERYLGKYTLEDNLHITLTFIGEVEQKVSYMLSQIGDKAFSDYYSFSIEVSSINSFKDNKISYFEVEESEELTLLHNNLNYLLDNANMVYTHNDKYVPHITFRRGKSQIISESIDKLTIEVNEIALFESKRVDDVLRYVPIKVWRAKER